MRQLALGALNESISALKHTKWTCNTLVTILEHQHNAVKRKTIISEQ